jgi:hypothetical protein
MNRRSASVMLVILLLLILHEYAEWTYQNDIRAVWIVFGTEMRPYSYRALIPLLGRVLVIIGIRPTDALMVLVMLSGIGLVYGLIYFSRSMDRE